MGRFLAGFIMTYERHERLTDTINKIFSQTLPPEILLIVDNSETDRTKEIISQMDDHRLRYFRIGYNAGPAGAAYHGIRILAEEGYDWIFWGDDDDPPRDPTTFEEVLAIRRRVGSDRIGALGLMGNRFDFKNGKFVRLTNTQLHGIVEVDAIAGNNTLIVNGEAARTCDLPDPDLFFGLEELDYCRSLKRGGFKLFVDGDLYFQHRKRAGKDQNDIRISNYNNLSFDIRKRSLWREYYSIRNLVFILLYKEARRSTAAKVVLKSLLKSIVSFRRGWKFGSVYLKLTVSAIFAGLTRKMGKKYTPESMIVELD